jgi:hypothetical protein
MPRVQKRGRCAEPPPHSFARFARVLGLLPALGRAGPDTPYSEYMTPDNAKPKPPPDSGRELVGSRRLRSGPSISTVLGGFTARPKTGASTAMRKCSAVARPQRGPVMTIKQRLLTSGVWLRPTPLELFLMAHDWRTWAETERDPEKAAKLNHHGDRCEAR